MFNRPDLVDEIHYTLRGAECRVDSTLARRHQWKREARLAVLREQEAQKASDEYDQDWISAVYCQASQASVFEARDAALQDQADAEAYYNENEAGAADDFDDAWISSLSSSSSSSSSTFEYTYDQHEQQPSVGLVNAYDVSGFDDSWLRDM